MATSNNNSAPKILILATLSGGYRGADAAGQSHKEYEADVYILPVLSAAMFPPEFYMRAFERSVDAIIVMYSGTDSPYKGAPEHTGKLINDTYELMKARRLNLKRLRLSAICTVCVEPFIREIEDMNAFLKEVGPLPRPLAPAPEAQSLAA